MTQTDLSAAPSAPLHPSVLAPLPVGTSVRVSLYSERCAEVALIARFLHRFASFWRERLLDAELEDALVEWRLQLQTLSRFPHALTRQDTASFDAALADAVCGALAVRERVQRSRAAEVHGLIPGLEIIEQLPGVLGEEAQFDHLKACASVLASNALLGCVLDTEALLACPPGAMHVNAFTAGTLALSQTQQGDRFTPLETVTLQGRIEAFGARTRFLDALRMQVCSEFDTAQEARERLWGQLTAGFGESSLTWTRLPLPERALPGQLAAMAAMRQVTWIDWTALAQETGLCASSSAELTQVEAVYPARAAQFLLRAPGIQPPAVSGFARAVALSLLAQFAGITEYSAEAPSALDRALELAYELTGSPLHRRELDLAFKSGQPTVRFSDRCADPDVQLARERLQALLSGPLDLPALTAELDDAARHFEATQLGLADLRRDVRTFVHEGAALRSFATRAELIEQARHLGVWFDRSDALEAAWNAGHIWHASCGDFAVIALQGTELSLLSSYSLDLASSHDPMIARLKAAVSAYLQEHPHS